MVIDAELDGVETVLPLRAIVQCRRVLDRRDLAEIDVVVFELGRPIGSEHVFDAGAGGPRRDQDYEFAFSTIVPTLQAVSPADDVDVNAAGGQDNITVVVGRVIDQEPPKSFIKRLLRRSDSLNVVTG